jgi:hypothetical protein
MKLALLLLGLALALLGGAWAWATVRWRSDTRELRQRLLSTLGANPSARFSLDQLAGLPAPVERYLRIALREGQPLFRHVHLRQVGQFLVRPKDSVWTTFTAEEDLLAHPSGFLWDARMRMAPGVAVHVRDALVGGRGSMVGKLAGLITVIHLEGTPGVAAGAMHRYLAEAVWCPTALLPTAGVAWSPLDDSTARATLTLQSVSVTLDFHFGSDGLVHRVYAADRQYTEGDSTVPMPWQGYWSEYELHDGMRVPMVGKVEWLLPTGPQPYWRGRVTSLLYQP